MALLLDRLRRAGANEQAAALLARDPTAHANLDNPTAVAWLLYLLCLLDRLRAAGANEQAAALLARTRPPAPTSTTRAPWPSCWPACARRARTSRPPRWPAGPPPTPTSTTRTPWPPCWTACGGGRARAGRRAGPRAAAHATLDDPAPWTCCDGLREAGAHEQAAALARRAAAHSILYDLGAVDLLLDRLREAGADEQAAALLARDPAAHAPLDDPSGVAGLLDGLRVLSGAQDSHGEGL